MVFMTIYHHVRYDDGDYCSVIKLPQTIYRSSMISWLCNVWFCDVPYGSIIHAVTATTQWLPSSHKHTFTKWYVLLSLFVIVCIVCVMTYLYTKAYTSYQYPPSLPISYFAPSPPLPLSHLPLLISRLSYGHNSRRSDQSMLYIRKPSFLSSIIQELHWILVAFISWVGDEERMCDNHRKLYL